MSADEIRRLAKSSAICGPACANPSLCKKEQSKECVDAASIRAALLDYAAMVERCEKLIKPCNLEDAPCVPSDTGYCDSCDVPRHNDMINYILK